MLNKKSVLGLIVSIIVIGFIYLFINNNIFHKVYADSQTVLSNNNIVDVDSKLSFSTNDDSAKIDNQNGLIYNLSNIPLFSKDEKTVQTTTDSELLIFDETPYSIKLKPSSIVKDNNGEMSVSNKNSLSLESIELDINKTKEKYGDTFIYYNEFEYFLFYESILNVGQEDIIIPSMSFYKVDEDIINIYTMLNGQLTASEYEYSGFYSIDYGDLSIDEDTINDSQYIECVKSEDLNFEEAFIDENNTIINEDGQIIDQLTVKPVSIISEPEVIEQTIDNSENNDISENNNNNNNIEGEINADNNGGGEDKPENPEVTEPIENYTNPSITNAEIVTKDITPYEPIQVRIDIENPDEFEIISLNTSEGTFMINSTDKNGSFYFNLSPKKAGQYRLGLTSLIVSKDSSDIIDLDYSLDYTVENVPYILTSDFGYVKSDAKSSDLIITFSDSIKNMKINKVVIEGVTYTNIEKISDNQIVVNDVEVDSEIPGKIDRLIDSYDFTYNNKKYNSNQSVYNQISGYILKEKYDQNSIKTNFTIDEDRNIIYNLTVDDPEQSIKNIEINLLDKETDQSVATITNNNKANGEYKFIFENIQAGIDYIFSITIFSDLGNGEISEYNFIENDSIKIPFKTPELNDSYMSEVIVDQDDTNLFLEIDNPDQYQIESVTLNDKKYKNVVEVDQELYKVSSIPFSNSTEYSEETYILTEIEYINPLDQTEVYTYNEKMISTHLIEPEIYVNTNDKIVVDWQFAQTREDYTLNIVINDGNHTEEYSEVLSEGYNQIEFDMNYQTDSIWNIECSISSENTEVNMINLSSDEILFTSKISTSAITEDTSIYIQDNNELMAYGEDDSVLLDVPKGEYNKIIAEQNTAMALNNKSKEAVAWGINADLINSELEQYQGHIIDIYLSPTQQADSYLVGVVLDDGTYQLIGTDDHQRISLAPYLNKEQVSKLYINDYSVSLITEEGELYVGGSTDEKQDQTIDLIPRNYTNQKINVLDFSLGQSAFTLTDEDDISYYDKLDGNPDYEVNDEYKQLQYVNIDNKPILIALTDQTLEIISNPEATLIIQDVPDYILGNLKQVIKVDVQTTNNAIVYYQDGTYTAYGSDKNNFLNINQINHIPNIINQEMIYQNPDLIIPGEVGTFKFNLENNLDGLIVKDITIEDEDGKKETYEALNEHLYDEVQMYNLDLNGEVGKNKYKITNITYQNRYNLDEIYEYEYTDNFPSFLIEYSEGISVHQGIDSNLVVSYGMLDNSSDIKISMREEDTEYKEIESFSPNKENYIIEDIDQNIIVQVQVTNGIETYESNYINTVDNVQGSYMTSDSVTTQQQSGKLISEDNEQYNDYIAMPENDNYIKIDSIGKVHFGLKDDKSIDVWGEKEQVDQYEQLFSIYQGGIIDFQIIGVINGSNLPIINLYMNNGKNQLVIADSESINWDVNELEDENMIYATGNQDIIYFIRDDGTFGMVGSDSPEGSHTINPIPITILNGSLKIVDIEYTLSATYIQDVLGNIYVIKTDAQESSQACKPEDKKVKNIDSATGYNIDDTKYSNIYVTYEDGTNYQCEQSGDQQIKNKYQNNSKVVPVNDKTEITTGINGVMYDNENDYYLVSDSQDQRRFINYNPINPEFNLKDIATDSILISESYEYKNTDATYKLIDSQTGKEISNNYIVQDDGFIVLDYNPGDQFSIDVQASYDDYEGNEYVKVINNEPIEGTIKTEYNKYISPQITNITNIESSNAVNSTIEIYNPGHEQLNIELNIDQKDYQLVESNIDSTIETYEYSIQNNPNFEYTINAVYDNSKVMDYYGSDNQEFYEVVINSKLEEGNSYKLNDNFGTFIYKSPLNDKYYSFGQLVGLNNVVGTETKNPGNYVYDEEGKYNDQFAYENNSTQYNGQCSSLNYTEGGTSTNINMDNSCSKPSGNSSSMGFTDNTLSIKNVTDNILFELVDLKQMNDGSYIWNVDFVSSEDTYSGSEDFQFDIANGENKLVVQTDIDNIDIFETEVYYMPDEEWQMFADSTSDVVEVDYQDISTCQDLDQIPDDSDVNYQLTQNIDCNSNGNYTGASNYSGEFNGNGYTVSNIQSDYSGLFNSLIDGAVIKNVQVIGNIYIDYSKSSVGMIANSTSGNVEIYDILVDGDILVDAKNQIFIGGVIGKGSSSGETNIHESYSSVNIDVNTSTVCTIAGFGYYTNVENSIYSGSLSGAATSSTYFITNGDSTNNYVTYISEASTSHDNYTEADANELAEPLWYSNVLKWNTGATGEQSPWYVEEASLGHQPNLYNSLSIYEFSVVNDEEKQQLEFEFEDLKILNDQIQSLEIIDRYSVEETTLKTLDSNQTTYTYKYDDQYPSGEHIYYLKVNGEYNTYYSKNVNITLNTNTQYIYTCQELNLIPNFSEVNYTLMNDIDCADVNDYNSPGSYSGEFNGNGYQIYNFHTESDGVFASLSTGAYVHDLIIKGNINTKDSSVSHGDIGMLANITNGPDIIIENVGVEGSISSASNTSSGIGGMIGNSKSDGLTINDCYSKVNIYINNQINSGGKVSGVVNSVDQSSQPEINNVLYSGSKISLPAGSTIDVGYIISSEENTNISNSYYSDSAEIINGQVINQENQVNEISNNKLSDIKFYSDDLKWDTINTWNTSSLSEVNPPVLFNMIPTNIELVEDDYNSDNQTFELRWNKPEYNVDIDHININSYDSKGNSETIEIDKNITEYMYRPKTQVSEINVEYVFADGSSISSNQLSFKIEETTYIPISTCQELDDIEDDSTYNYILINSIDCSSIQDYSGASHFSGEFNGDGYQISNLYSTDGGLFESLSDGSVVKNLSVSEEINDSTKQAIGVIANKTSGNVSVENIIVDGEIYSHNSNNNYGGVVGKGSEDLNISNVYSSVDLIGDINNNHDSYAYGINKEANVENSLFDGNIYGFELMESISSDNGKNNYKTSNSYLDTNEDDGVEMVSDSSLSNPNWYSDTLNWSTGSYNQENIFNVESVSIDNDPTLYNQIRTDDAVEVEYDDSQENIIISWGEEITDAEFDNINIYYGNYLDNKKKLLDSVSPKDTELIYSIDQLSSWEHYEFYIEYTNDDQYVGSLPVYDVILESPEKIEINSCQELDAIPNDTSISYILTDNINCSNNDFTPSYDFKGELDGNGYKVYGLTDTLFENTENAYIHNFHLNSDLEYNSSNDSPMGLVAKSMKNTVVENLILTGSISDYAYREDPFKIGSLAGYTENGEVENIYSSVDLINQTGGRTDSSGLVYSATETIFENNLYTGFMKNYGSSTHLIANGGEQTNNYYYGEYEEDIQEDDVIKVTSEQISDSQFYADNLKWDTDEIFNVKNVNLINYPTLNNELRIIKDIEVNGDEGSIELMFDDNLYNPEQLVIDTIDVHEITNGNDHIIDTLNGNEKYYNYELQKPYEYSYQYYITYNLEDGESISSQPIDYEVEYSDIIEIESCSQLDAIENNSSNNYILTKSINCSGIDYTGAYNYSGRFDGNGYTISNLTSDNGLFSSTKDAQILDLAIIGNIDYDQDYYSPSIGMFVGESRGSLEISNSSASGNINLSGQTYETSYVGSMVGVASSQTYIHESYSNVSFDTRDFDSDKLKIGGMIGYANDGANVVNSYYGGTSVKYQDETEFSSLSFGNIYFDNYYYYYENNSPVYTNKKGYQISSYNLGEASWYSDKLGFDVGYNSDEPWNVDNVSINNQPTLYNTPRPSSMRNNKSSKGTQDDQQIKVELLYLEDGLSLTFTGDKDKVYNIYLNEGLDNIELNDQFLIAENISGVKSEYYTEIEDRSNDFTYVITTINNQKEEIIYTQNVLGSKNNSFKYNLNIIQSKVKISFNNIQTNISISNSDQNQNLDYEDIYNYNNKFLINLIPSSNDYEQLIELNNLDANTYDEYANQVNYIYQEQENGQFNQEEVESEINQINLEVNEDEQENYENKNSKTNINKSTSVTIPHEIENNNHIIIWIIILITPVLIIYYIKYKH